MRIHIRIEAESSEDLLKLLRDNNVKVEEMWAINHSTWYRPIYSIICVVVGMIIAFMSRLFDHGSVGHVTFLVVGGIVLFSAMVLPFTMLGKSTDLLADNSSASH